MTVLLNASAEPTGWAEAFARRLPDHTIALWPEVGDPAEIRYVVAWRHDLADLHRYPGLRAILSTGAGVDQFLGPEAPDVPVVRLADPSMASDMAAYALHWVVHFHRRFDLYAEHQDRALWHDEPSPAAAAFTVGVLGYGRIGSAIGAAARHLGYRLATWSRRPPEVDERVQSFVGPEEMQAFLSACDAVVNVLPATPATRHLLDEESLGWCRQGAVLVNVGRGSTVDEPALVTALDSGRLHAAVLDVTEIEPLPADSPLWHHPRVRITPHISGVTRVETSVDLIASNIERIDAGLDPFPLADPDRGY